MSSTLTFESQSEQTFWEECVKAAFRSGNMRYAHENADIQVLKRRERTPAQWPEDWKAI